MTYVLDTSAVLALLLNERGGEVVGPLMRESELSIVNLCEVFTKVAESGGDVPTTDRIIQSFGIRIRAFRESHAIRTAELRPLTQHLGLSLGDRACLSQAHFTGGPILTADRRMAEAQVGIDIRLIR